MMIDTLSSIDDRDCQESVCREDSHQEVSNHCDLVEIYTDCNTAFYHRFPPLSMQYECTLFVSYADNILGSTELRSSIMIIKTKMIEKKKVK